MQRTQIYLPKTQREALRKEARKRNSTVSGLIRLFVEERLMRPARQTPARKHETLLEAGRRINAKGNKGPADVATNLDDYLYGGKK